MSFYQPFLCSRCDTTCLVDGKSLPDWTLSFVLTNYCLTRFTCILFLLLEYICFSINLFVFPMSFFWSASQKLHWSIDGETQEMEIDICMRNHIYIYIYIYMHKHRYVYMYMYVVKVKRTKICLMIFYFQMRLDFVFNWNHFEMRLLNLRINFYLLRTFCPHLGSFLCCFFFHFVSAKFHLWPSSGDFYCDLG